MIAPLLLAVALAQTPPVLTLDQALTQAAERNLDLKAARARLDQAHQLSWKAWSGYLPQLSAGGTYSYSNLEAKIALPTGYYVRNVGIDVGPPFDPNQPVSIDNPPGLPTPYTLVPSGMAEAVIQEQHQFAGQLQATQGLLLPALWPAIHNAALAEQLTELTTENIRREVLFATAQLYFGAAGLQQALAVQEQLLEVNLKHEADAKVRHGLGALPKVAWLRAQIERAKSEQDVRRAQNALASAKSALAVLLDREPDFEVAKPPASTDPGDLTRLEGQANDKRPDVQAARVALKLAEGGRRGVIFKYLPNVVAVARYQASNARGFTGSYDSWMAGVNVSWTLWDGGLREAELREAAAKIAESTAQLAATEAKARDEVRRALLDLESARANRLKAAEQVKLARENATLVEASYEAGAGTYLEVIDANAALLGAEISHISEDLNAELAVLRVAKAAGDFNP